jgi:YD repeat-containing protein
MMRMGTFLPMTVTVTRLRLINKWIALVTTTNKLDFIKDDIATANYDNDIDNQSVGNYDYDAIGNLVKDSTGGISNINWNVYGKIAAITKTNGTTISYTYDVVGNRVSKTVNGVQTWYVRDASGNVY